MKSLFAALLTVGLMANLAYAHNGMEHVMGTVAMIAGGSITVITIDGKSETVTVNSATKYSRGNTAIQLGDLKVGDHVVIHATEKDDRLTAAFVKAGKTRSRPE